MRLFRWQQLPLLIILIHFLEPITTHNFLAEASFTFKSEIANCYKSKDRGVTFTSSFQAKLLGRSLRFGSRILSSQSSVPTLTGLQEEGHEKKHKKKKIAAVIGGVVAALLVVIVVLLVYVCLIRIKRLIARASDDSASSLPSDLHEGDTSPYAVPLSPFETPDLKEFTYSELEQATGNFSRKNIIGEGRFGLVYKGLLQDGSIVAVKRRQNPPPNRSFFHQVKQIARIRHAHLVKLIGYYIDTNRQLLVYDSLSNGNVGYHLYDSSGFPVGKLGIRQRLSIALGAAKGLGHLHSFVPPVLHMNFRTRNVLLDENFTAKVSDFGLTKLLIEGDHAGSSSSIDYFLDPELDTQKSVSERCDVYSFGVFLLEMISGHEANAKNSEESLVSRAKRRDFEAFVDKSLGRQATQAAKQTMELALACIDSSPQRPLMRFLVEELERIHGVEMARLSSELDVQISSVTLGSELFK